MVVRRDRRLLLVRRNIGGNKPDLLQPELGGGRARHHDVAAMDGVEGTAKQCEIHSDGRYSFRVSQVGCKRSGFRRTNLRPQALKLSLRSRGSMGCGFGCRLHA